MVGREVGVLMGSFVGDTELLSRNIRVATLNVSPVQNETKKRVGHQLNKRNSRRRGVGRVGEPEGLADGLCVGRPVGLLLELYVVGGVGRSVGVIAVVVGGVGLRDGLLLGDLDGVRVGDLDGPHVVGGVGAYY